LIRTVFTMDTAGRPRPKEAGPDRSHNRGNHAAPEGSVPHKFRFRVRPGGVLSCRRGGFDPREMTLPAAAAGRIHTVTLSPAR